MGNTLILKGGKGDDVSFVKRGSRVRELLPHIGPIPIRIPLKLFLVKMARNSNSKYLIEF